MNKLGIIAFCGSKFSGKSTSATLFRDLIGVPTEEIAIAGHLKEACARVFGVDYNKFIDPNFKEVELDEYVLLTSDNLKALMKEFDVTDYKFDKHIRLHMGRILRTPRTLLQYIGTEVLHPIDPLIHAKKALRKKDPAKLTVITDLRFVAEFEYFKQLENFMPVYVKNTSAETAASVDGHASERQYEQFKGKCYLLDNDDRVVVALKASLNRLVLEMYHD